MKEFLSFFLGGFYWLFALSLFFASVGLIGMFEFIYYLINLICVPTEASELSFLFGDFLT